MAEDSDPTRPVASPFKIDQDAADYDELRQFVARAKPVLLRAFAEVLSDETRKAQRSLLAFSFVVMLLALGALRFSGTIKYGGLAFSLEAALVLKAASALCLYFEILVCIRCFNDWSSYRVRGSMPELDLDALNYELYVAGPPRPV